MINKIGSNKDPYDEIMADLIRSKQYHDPTGMLLIDDINGQLVPGVLIQYILNEA